MSVASTPSLGTLNTSSSGKNSPPNNDKKFLDELVKSLVDNDKFRDELVKSLAQNEDFIDELTSRPMPKVVKSLSKEQRRWILLSFGLAIGSLVIIGVVYWLSFVLGGGKAIETFAVPIIGAFCFVILVINVAFTMVVIKIRR